MSQLSLRIPTGRICKQATYLQMNNIHTTQWSVKYSVYMETSYMCIRVIKIVFCNYQ